MGIIAPKETDPLSVEGQQAMVLGWSAA
jgi:hypothetical protein